MRGWGLAGKLSERAHIAKEARQQHKRRSVLKHRLHRAKHAEYGLRGNHRRAKKSSTSTSYLHLYDALNGCVALHYYTTDSSTTGSSGTVAQLYLLSKQVQCTMVVTVQYLSTNPLT